MLMVKNDEYYDADSIKMPAIKGIMVNDENTSLQGYKAGDIHCTEVIPAEEIPTLLAEDPNLYVSPLPEQNTWTLTWTGIRSVT